MFPQLTRLIDRPTLAEAEAIGDLIVEESMGSSDFGQPIAKPLSFWKALAKPSLLLAQYRQAPWRLGLLVRIIRSPGLACAAMNLRRRLELRTKSA